MKKYLAEAIGTMVLVLMWCGAATIAGATNTGAIGRLGVALAFGLAVLIMVYAIWPISGCHINPAITFAMRINKKIWWKDAIWYVVAQCVGALIGAGILACIVGHVSGLAVNSIDPYGLGYGMGQALVIETVMTFIFLFVIFGATSSKAPAGFAGIAIGLALALIHLVSIPVTNTSVNPARSLAPALFDSFAGNMTGLSHLRIFIVGPIVGALLAALVWKYISWEKAKA